MTTGAGYIHWYGLKVFFNKVFEIESLLSADGVESYIPCEMVTVEVRGIWKQVRRTVIPSLMFFRSTEEYARELQTSPPPSGPRDAVYLCERKVEEGSLSDFGIRDGYVQARHLVGGRRARLFRGRQHRLRHRGPRPRHGRGFQGRRGLHQADQGKAEVDRLHHGHLRRGHLVHPELLFAEDLRGRSRPQFRGSRIG